jgi:murein DD-endopeptidase MepM/ murein hydrolase activator NlpD
MNDGTGNISNFGDARPQTTGTHMGTDFAAPVGTPIYSNIEGTVTRVTTDGNYGLRVEVTAADGTKYQLAHLDATDVTVGQKIGSGDFVAFAGGSGNANATNGPRVPGYEPKGGTVGDAGTPAPGNPYDTTVPASAPDGYSYGGYDEGGKFYTSADGNTSVQYDPATKSWTAYDANTGDVLADQSAAANLAPDPSNLPGQAPASAGAPGTNAAGAAAGPAAAALGGAGARAATRQGCARTP